MRSYLMSVKCSASFLSPVPYSGDEVRRYISGPPGPQGPPGPPGSSVGISASYSVEEIARYVFNIMTGKHRLEHRKTAILETESEFDQLFPFLFSDRGIARGPPGPPGPPGPSGPGGSGFSTATIDYSALIRST